jgi:outer membrane protein OmpA-like peptidoglycan-associated protein
MTAEQRAAAEAARQAALDAEKAKADADRARSQSETDAQRRAQELEAQAREAQAEVEKIKQMIAQKDLPAINFRAGSADLTVESHQALQQVAALAKKYPDLKLRVEGHTDSQGGVNFNQKLSQKRADAVRGYLVHGGPAVPPAQVVAAGFGPTRPIASNDTAEGRAQNRRVEFIFYLK